MRRGCGGAPRLHTLFKPLPPLRRPTGPSDQITIRGIMRLATQQKRAHTRIRPRLRRLSRAMTRPPRRRPAPKDRIKNPKRDSCDGRALFQRGCLGIQFLPLDGVGGLLSPSGDLVRGEPHVCFGILPIHRAESFDLFLPGKCLFPCESAKIFGRPWFLSFSFFGRPRHSTVGTLRFPTPLRGDASVCSTNTPLSQGEETNSHNSIREGCGDRMSPRKGPLSVRSLQGPLQTRKG